MLKNIGHMDIKLKICCHTHFNKNNKSYQIYVAEKYALVISLIMFYHNRKTVVYKATGSVIYLFVDNYIFVDYLGIIQ